MPGFRLEQTGSHLARLEIAVAFTFIVPSRLSSRPDSHGNIPLEPRLTSPLKTVKYSSSLVVYIRLCP